MANVLLPWTKKFIFLRRRGYVVRFSDGRHLHRRLKIRKWLIWIINEETSAKIYTPLCLVAVVVIVIAGSLIKFFGMFQLRCLPQLVSRLMSLNEGFAQRIAEMDDEGFF